MSKYLIYNKFCYKKQKSLEQIVHEEKNIYLQKLKGENCKSINADNIVLSKILSNSSQSDHEHKITWICSNIECKNKLFWCQNESDKKGIGHCDACSTFPHQKQYGKLACRKCFATKEEICDEIDEKNFKAFKLLQINNPWVVMMVMNKIFNFNWGICSTIASYCKYVPCKSNGPYCNFRTLYRETYHIEYNSIYDSFYDIKLRLLKKLDKNIKLSNMRIIVRGMVYDDIKKFVNINPQSLACIHLIFN